MKTLRTIGSLILVLLLATAAAPTNAWAFSGPGDKDKGKEIDDKKDKDDDRGSNKKYCNLHMGCNCACKPGEDSRRGHEDHLDVKCPMCNKYFKKKGRNIRSGYYCPEKNDWVD